MSRTDPAFSRQDNSIRRVHYCHAIERHTRNKILHCCCQRSGIILIRLCHLGSCCRSQQRIESLVCAAEKLLPVMNELAYNLESFNPAFTAVLLKVTIFYLAWSLLPYIWFFQNNDLILIGDNRLQQAMPLLCSYPLNEEDGKAHTDDDEPFRRSTCIGSAIGLVFASNFSSPFKYFQLLSCYMRASKWEIRRMPSWDLGGGPWDWYCRYNAV